MESQARSHSGPPKLVIIGLDGATFSVLGQMARAGVTPTLSRLMAEGSQGTLLSTIPTNSAAAWVSLMTGKNPGKHGLFEFQFRPDPRSPRKIIANSRCIDGETVWHILSRHAVTSVVVNMPITYPPPAIKGAVISGIPIPGGSRSWTYPEGLAEELRTNVGEYVIGTPWRYFLGRVEPFLRSLIDMTRKRVDATVYLLKRYEPEVLAIVFVGPDRLQHWLWHHIDPSHARYSDKESQKYLPQIEEYFFELDRGIERILAAVGDGATVLVPSDHGFHRAEKQLSLNDWLEEQGLLGLQARSFLGLLQPLRSLRGARAWALRRWYRGHIPPGIRRLAPKRVIDWQRTKAYVPWAFQEGISLNVSGREPWGIVQPNGQFEELRAWLREALTHLEDPASGEPAIKQVLYRDEVYCGPHVDCAADVVLVANDGYCTAPPPHPHMAFASTGWTTGSHDRKGIFIARGPAIRRTYTMEEADITDVAPTILYLLDLPVPTDMDGQVMEGIIEPSFRERHPIVTEDPPMGQDAGSPDIFRQDEERDLRERLRGMGYLS